MGLALMEEVSLGMSPGLGPKVTTLLLSSDPETLSTRSFDDLQDVP